MFRAQLLPEFRANLVPALADLECHDLARHGTRSAVFSSTDSVAGLALRETSVKGSRRTLALLNDADSEETTRTRPRRDPNQTMTARARTRQFVLARPLGLMSWVLSRNTRLYPLVVRRGHHALAVKMDGARPAKRGLLNKCDMEALRLRALAAQTSCSLDIEPIVAYQLAASPSKLSKHRKRKFPDEESQRRDNWIAHLRSAASKRKRWVEAATGASSAKRAAREAANSHGAESEAAAQPHALPVTPGPSARH